MRTTGRTAICVLVLAGLAYRPAIAPAGQPATKPAAEGYRIEDTVLGKAPFRVGLAHAAADGRHAAWTVGVDSPRLLRITFRGEPMHLPEADNYAVWADGRLGPKFDEVGAYWFSEAGGRFAYEASLNKRRMLVVDQKPGPAFDAVGEVTFSPDGKRIAFIAGRGASHFLVRDGKRRDTGGELVWHGPLPAAEPVNLAYVDARDGKKRLVINGRPGEAFDELIAPRHFTPDGQHHAYVARRGKNFLVVHDGQAGPEYPAIWKHSLRMSDDGVRWGYVAIVPEKSNTLVIDCKPVLSDDYITPPVFSPDSKRYVAAALYGKGANKQTWRLILDGKPGPVQATMFTSQPPQFTPDSQRVAWATAQNVIIDGQPGPAFDEMVSPDPFLRPDGSVEYLTVKDDVVHRVRHIPLPHPR